MAKSVDKKMLRVSLDKVFKKEDYIRTLLRQKDSIKLKEYFDGVTEYSFNKRKLLSKRISKNLKELGELKQQSKTLRQKLRNRIRL